MSQTVHDFFDETLKGHALDKLFKGEEAKDVAEAKKVVDIAFSKLREMFEEKIINPKKLRR